MRNDSISASTAEPSIGADSPELSGATPGIVFAGILIGWTLFVWVGRLRNIFLDDELAGWSQAWRFTLAASFVVLALVAGGLLARAVFSRSGPDSGMRLPRRAVGLLAIFGIIVWLIRGTDIFFGNHELAFKVVHTVLAGVTITLGVVVLQRFVRAESVPFSE